MVVIFYKKSGILRCFRQEILTITVEQYGGILRFHYLESSLIVREL